MTLTFLWLFYASIVAFGVFGSDLLNLLMKIGLNAYFAWKDRDLIAKRKSEYEALTAQFYAAAAEEKAAQLTDDVEGLPHA